jgi:N-acetyl-gamma-glutamyl-phosphate reductase
MTLHLPHFKTTTAPISATNDGPAGTVATVGIVGGSGYTGALLAELLLRHPSVALTHMSSEQLAGQPVHGHLPRLHTGLAFCRQEEVTGVDVAFLCTPHGQAASVAKRLLDEGTRVIDLSADFRLEADLYEEWYAPHPHPELTPGVYGLTELRRDDIARARLVANPGCYPTAALLALSPILPLGLLDVVIDAKSGVTGAGKVPTSRTHFCSIDSDLVAYGIASHRHQPEITGGLDPQTTLTFVPHLVPLQRGISETLYVRAAHVPPPAEILELYHKAYDDELFVDISETPPELKDVAHTNTCRIFVTVDEGAGRIIIVTVIDNLMKGAAGQAVQNMNVMLGLPEHWGLV